MPRELIFTSVPKGVKPGSTGYCTVAKHKGIDRLLDQALEKLCFYELMKLATKPVVHNYSILSLNTGTFHVLTRTCYSGSDHTGRTNYISHNLIFDQSEIYSQQVSPAEIFLRGTGWLSVWPQGQSPTFFEEGICKVSIPAPSGNPSHLPTWDQLTGKSLLAHELKGYTKWKFITEGGEHHKTLSLLSEFAWLDPSYLQLSWSQLTFTTYLQPSERAANFKIVAGDLSVPAFQAISCTTLNISSTGGANVCFSSTGTGQFGPLPENNQPILDETKEVSEPVPIQPVSDSPNLTPKQPTIVSVQPTTLGVSPTAALPPRQSNLSLNPGQTSGSENLFGPDDIPEIKNSKKISKLLIFLISLIGIGVLGAATFAVIYFWPEKATRGNAKPAEVAQAEGQEQSDSDDVNISDGAEPSKRQPEKSEQNEDSGNDKVIPEPDTPEKPLPELKSEFYALVKTIKNSINSSEKDAGLEDKFSQLRKKKSQIEKDFPEEKSNKEYGNKIEQLEELSSNPLPETIPLVIDSEGTFSGFPFRMVDRRPDAPNKTYFWDHKNKTCIDDSNQTAMHEAFWIKNEMKPDDSGQKIPFYYLLKDKSYSLDKDSFSDLKGLKIPGNYSVKPELKSVPNFKNINNVGRGTTDKRLIGPVEFTKDGGEKSIEGGENEKIELNTVSFFKCLNELKVNLIFTKRNKLEFQLVHESGKPATNVSGKLINQDGDTANFDEFFSKSVDKFSKNEDKWPSVKEVIKKFIRPYDSKVSNNKIIRRDAFIDEKIKESKNAEKTFEKNKEELKELLDAKLDFSNKTPEGKKELEIEISEEAIDQIEKFKLEKKLPKDFDKAFKDKNLFKNINGSWVFDDWLKLRTTYKDFKTDEWDDKISKAEKNKDEAEKKRRDADKKDRKKYEALEDKSEEELREVKEDKQEWLKDFGNIFPVNPPREFRELKNKIDKFYDSIIKYTDPFSETDLEELEKYKKNLELFVNGPSYPWNVVDQQSEKTVLIIK